MRRLTLIRHGITDWNAAGRIQGQSDVPLSTLGREQARQLASYVAAVQGVDVVIASPLQRAVETARIAFPQIPLLTDPRLQELDFGVFEGTTTAENEADPRWLAWMKDPFELPAPEGESYRQLRARAEVWLAEAVTTFDQQHVVAVSHSGTIQMLLSGLLGVEHPRWRKRIYLRHTGVSHVLFRGGDAVIERVNDTRHLVADGADPFGE